MLDKDGISICLVDGDDVVREALTAMLEASGYAVTCFASGGALLAAEAKVARRARTCLVLDLDLSDMSGIELARRLRAAGSTTPFVVTTARPRRGDEARVRAAGAAVFLDKPISRQRLVSAIERAMAGRRPRHG